MTLTLRKETPSDYKAVGQLIHAAFKDEPLSDQTESLLVARLRTSEAFIPALSIVAEDQGTIVGHILLTKIKIINSDATFPSLALAPVSVLPARQRKGIGGQLIQEAHRQAKALGFSSIVLLGHEGYYPRFGYERTSKYGIELPFPAPDANCMVIALSSDGLEGVSGMVEYAKEFLG